MSDPPGKMPIPMAAEIFTEDWARAWCREVHSSEGFRAAAAGWDGAIVAVLESDPEGGISEDRRVLLALSGEGCGAGREATPADVEAAVFVLSAPARVWRSVFAGETEPVWALMSGAITLAKGSVDQLTPFAGAARALFEAARRVPSSPAGTRRAEGRG